MRKLLHGLPLLGVLVMIGSQVPTVASHLPGRPQVWLAGGLFLVLLYVTLRWDDVVGSVGRRQLRYGGNTVVLSAAVLGILVAVNWIANRNPVRFDLTKDRKYSLSDQTRKLLDGLKQDVKVTHFFVQEGDPGGAQRARDRLTEYQALSPRIKVQHVDVRKEPALARTEEIKAVPTLLIEYGGKREKINAVGEQDITNALIKLTRDTKKTVCFVKGDGERDLDGSDDLGLSKLRAALEKNQYSAETVSLLRAKVLEPCTVTVVAGPEQDLTPEAIEQLRLKVAGGGKALVFLEPEFKVGSPNLVGLLKEWGIEAGHDIVLDLVPRLTETGLVFTADERLIVEQYPYHEITKAFPFRTLYSGTRSVKPAPPGTGANAPRTQTIVETSADSWAKADVSLKPPLRLDEKIDKKGPIAIAVVATVPLPAPSPAPSPSPGAEEPKKPEGRVAAFGDVDFASNALVGAQGNENFLLNVVAWLSEDPDLISIKPRDPEDHRLTILPGSFQWTVIWATGLLALPVLFLILGTVTWWRRR